MAWILRDLFQPIKEGTYANLSFVDSVLWNFMHRFDQMLDSVVSVHYGPLLLAMTTCHSLTLINGELSGDPLDLIMFKATGWVSVTRPNPGYRCVDEAEFACTP